MSQADSRQQPDQLKTFARASPAEQARRAAVVLRETKRRFKAREGDLIACIQLAGNGGIEGEYARRVLRLVLHEWNLLAWAWDKNRTRTEVYRALDAAIRKAEARRGGWSVSGRAA